MQIVRIGDGSANQPSAEFIGAKAANLARVAALGVPVPPAFVVPVELCASISRRDVDAERKLTDSLAAGISFLESTTGRKFGDRRRPLLVSVRSGAARSMPGMLDTVLNVGCRPEATHGLVRMTGNPRFAWDCRQRFLKSFGGIVFGIEATSFAKTLAKIVAVENAGAERGLDCEALERLAEAYRHIIEDRGRIVPDDPAEQLQAAAHAVYHSWTGDRAVAYRRLQHLDDLQGTAVTVQAMVFGNRGASSASGVAFSRDPSTGNPQPVVDVLFESQGEDVVSGNRNPETEQAIRLSLPAVAEQLNETLIRLEAEFKDVQDVEFTIEDGKLWILQTRAAKRTPRAAVRFAMDLVKEGKITTAEALRRVEGINLKAIEQRRLVVNGNPPIRGIGASTGIAVGRAAFDTAGAQRLAAEGDPVILIRPETSTADIEGLAASVGIVTAIGGRTAHAALVARQMGKPCIVGCTGLEIKVGDRCAGPAGARIDEGDWLSIDGETGAIYLQRCDVAVDLADEHLAEIEHWRTRAAEHTAIEA